MFQLVYSRALKPAVLVLALSLFAITPTSRAQTNKVDFGFEGGPSVISLRGNEVLKTFYKAGMGFSGGLFCQFNLTKVISLRTNVALERKGAVADIILTDHLGNQTGKIKMHANFDYLTFPLLVRASLGDKFQFFVNAGPFGGYLLRQSIDGISGPMSGNLSLYKKFDAGVSAGLGILLPLGSKMAFSLEARNNIGMVNISTSVNASSAAIRTNSIIFLLGLTFKPGQKE